MNFIKGCHRPSRGLATVLVAGAVVLAGCGGTSESPAGESSGATRVVDTAQGEVAVPEDPKRVLVLNYALAGYLYELDVPVHAMTPEDADAGKGEFSPFWEEQAEEDGTEFLPWSTDGFSLEAIMEMEPDLIIGGGLGFPYAQAVDVYDDLNEIAPTVLVDDKLETWQKQFSFLAKDVFDRPDRYTELTTKYEKRVAEVKKVVTVPPNPVAYLSLTGDNVAYGVVEDIALPQEMARLGFEPAPIFAENDLKPYGGTNDMFEISQELVSEIVTMPTVFVMGFNADTTDVKTLREDPIYASLPAFENGNAYDLPYWALRADYHESMALLDHVEEQFG